MASIISSKSSSSLFNSIINKEDTVEMNQNKDNDKDFLRHCSLIAMAFLNKEDSLTKSSLSVLYVNKQNKEEEIKNNESENNNNNSSSCIPFIHSRREASISTFPKIDQEASDQPSTTTSSPLNNSPSLLQGYSPQLCLNLYSPSSSVTSLCDSKSNMHHPSMTPVVITNDIANTRSILDATLPCTDPHHHLLRSYSNKSIKTLNSIKGMDSIDNLQQRPFASSRFLNALEKLKNKSANNQTPHCPAQETMMTVSHTTVVPAEIFKSLFSIKSPSPKNSLTERIKSKLQLNRYPKASQMTIESFNKDGPSVLGFTMPASDITNWPSLLIAGQPRSFHSKKQPQQPTLDEALHMSSETHPISSLSTSLSNTYPFLLADNKGISTRKSTHLPSASLSLTKSISSHRLYRKSSQRALKNKQQNQFTYALPAVCSPHSNRGYHLKPLQQQASSQFAYITVKQSVKGQRKVQFIEFISVKETYSKMDYDRTSDPNATCTRLTPEIAQKIKNELNIYKLHEMKVHDYSRMNTHFFL